jgi:hypothetical protein
MSDLVSVKIKGTVATQRYGTLVSGDILRTDAAYAKHLVEDCSAGSYVEAVTVNAEKVTKTRAKKPAKTTEEPLATEPVVEATEEALAETAQADTPAE